MKDLLISQCWALLAIPYVAVCFGIKPSWWLHTIFGVGIIATMLIAIIMNKDGEG